MTPRLIQVGVLSWPARERRSDRYGLVAMFQDEASQDTLVLPTDLPIDTYGRLEAQVKATRQSTHIGDLFRSLFPSIPQVGDRIVLGHGYLFLEIDAQDQQFVGLMPKDGRESDWLDPTQLYRVHHQTVELWFYPEPTP